MDVEALINELQSRSKPRNAIPASSNPPSSSLQPQHYQHQEISCLSSSLSSNITIINANQSPDEDSRSEASSVPLSQISDDHNLSHSYVSAVDGIQSWVKTESISINVLSPAPSNSASSFIAENRHTDRQLEVDNEPLVRIFKAINARNY